MIKKEPISYNEHFSTNPTKLDSILISSIIKNLKSLHGLFELIYASKKNDYDLMKKTTNSNVQLFSDDSDTSNTVPPLNCILVDYIYPIYSLLQIMYGNFDSPILPSDLIDRGEHLSKIMLKNIVLIYIQLSYFYQVICSDVKILEKKKSDYVNTTSFNLLENNIVLLDKTQYFLIIKKYTQYK